MLKVRLTPKSARDEIIGVENFGGEAVLKARVRALPEDGRANQALERLVARWLKVPPTFVSVAQGGKSRAKPEPRRTTGHLTMTGPSRRMRP